MTDTGLPKSLFVFLICVPLAIFLGYLLSTPMSFNTFATVGGCFMLLLLPLLLRWHHTMAIACWNAYVIVFFLPGQPSLGVVMACASLGFAVLHRTMSKSYRFIWVPQLSYSLLFLAIVVLVTMKLTGGMGGRALGSETWGAKRYLGVYGAIIGYFAFTSQRIDSKERLLLSGIFFLSGITAIFSDLAYAAGPSFYALYSIFPAELAASQAYAQFGMSRLTGVTWAAMSLLYFIIMRMGIAGLLDLTKPWRLAILLSILVISLTGGYRSTVIVFIILLVVQFLFEGLIRSRYLPILAILALLSGAFLVSFIDRLPLVVQRSMSFLPLDVDAIARQDAIGTLDWRLQIWKTVLPEIPNYLIVGKGYGYSGTDYYLTQEAVRRGLYNSFEDTLISGNYHNGILTVLIPFGLFGLFGFLWFCWSGWRVLYQNYLYGDAQLRYANTFLIAFFTARLIFYLTFYGQFDLDLMIFTGVVGLSVSLNGGVCAKKVAPKSIAAA
jgi:hypothetical protein